jgi:ribosome biogenesis GTPase
VKRAVEEGRLAPERFDSYLKLQQELETLEARKDTRARIDEKRKMKTVQQSLKKLYKYRGR